MPPSSHGVLQPERHEVNYHGPTGEVRHLGFTVTQLGAVGQAPEEFLFLFQDLTPIKAMEEHVRRLERLAVAGRIAAEIAHEIKNPLASMSGAVQMLESEARQDTQESRLMNIIQREIQRINELITDFLWLARGVRKSGVMERVDVCEVIMEMISLLKAREKIAPTHEIRTVFEGDPGLPAGPGPLPSDSVESAVERPGSHAAGRRPRNSRVRT